MRLTKRKICALAMMAAAVLVTVILLNPPKLNQLTVRLVDEDTKKPIDGKVRIWEHRPFPVLSSLKFLPPSLQGWLNTRSFGVRNGTFRVSRIANGQRRQLECRVNDFRTYHLEYSATVQGDAVFTSSRSYTHITPGQTEVSIPLFQP